ncbi:MAG: RNA polymerase sigma factor [Mediterranea sp.]|jgi:RNA polymerase sigma-70 factor (ECF subfamily)|nr:RNA polymerase sigma factor [Mediterranea sp.]
MQEINFRDDILPLKDKLFRLALRITFNRAEAEDIVQDTLIRVWDKREEWSQFGSIEAYCIAVARNLAIDRSQKKEAQHLQITPGMEEIGGKGISNPHEQLADNERIRLIHELINNLPEKQRLVMQMRDVEGAAYKEIAEALGLTEEQVKVNLFRARQKIKKQYTQIDEYGL